MTRSFLCLVYGFQFEFCEFCESAPPAWCMQVLMEFLYFPQSSHLCLSFWSHTECDEASSGNSVHRICLLPTQQAYPGFLSARGMSCLGHSLHSPRPTQKLGVELQGYLQTHLGFWCICKLQMSPLTPDFFMVNFFAWENLHVQRRINTVVSSLKFLGFFHSFSNNLLNKISFVSTAYWIKEEASHLGTSRFFISSPVDL